VSRVKTIVNNSPADRHIFLLKHSPFPSLNVSIQIFNSWTGFGSNRVVTNYLIRSEISNIRTTLLFTQSRDWKQNRLVPQNY